MNELIALGRKLWDLAEPGFFESETHRILKNCLLNLGLPVQEFDGLPSGDGGSYRHFCGKQELIARGLFESFKNFEQQIRLVRDDAVHSPANLVINATGEEPGSHRNA